MINGVVTGKLRNLRVRLDELRTLLPLTEQRLEDWIVLRAVERDCLRVAENVSISGHPGVSDGQPLLFEFDL